MIISVFNLHLQFTKNLYCMGFPLFDTPEVVDVMKAAGYDGAIYGGYGENMGSIEYRAFDRRQIDVLDVEFLNRKDEKDMEKEMEKKLPWDVKSKGPHIDSIEMMVSTAAEKETFSNRALFEAENYLRDVGLHGLPQETITVHTTAHYSDGKMVSFDVRTNPLLATKEQPLAECLWNALDKNPAYMQNPPEPQKFLVNAAVDNLYAKLFSNSYDLDVLYASEFLKHLLDQQNDLVLLLAVFVLALPKTFAKTCSHVLPHNGLKFGTSQDAKL